MADMTLKELRDFIRGWEAQSHADRYKYAECRDSPSEGTFSDWADAIDAHLAGMGEPVAWQYRILDDEDGPSPYWHDMTRKQFEIFREAAKPRYELRQLYTTPPASADVASLQSRLAAADALLWSIAAYAPPEHECVHGCTVTMCEACKLADYLRGPIQ